MGEREEGKGVGERERLDNGEKEGEINEEKRKMYDSMRNWKIQEKIESSNRKRSSDRVSDRNQRYCERERASVTNQGGPTEAPRSYVQILSNLGPDSKSQ